MQALPCVGACVVFAKCSKDDDDDDDYKSLSGKTSVLTHWYSLIFKRTIQKKMSEQSKECTFRNHSKTVFQFCESR